MKAKMIAPIKATHPQNEWLAMEKERTGNSVATIIRNLIQNKIDKEAV